MASVSPLLPELSQAHIESLAGILANLAAADNNIRSLAEQQLNSEWIAKSPSVLLCGLCLLTKTNSDMNLRSLAAILLRRIALRPVPAENGNADTLWMAIDGAHREFCNQQLLSAFMEEGEKYVRNKICDTVAELGRHVLVVNGAHWPELLQVVFSSSKSPIAPLRSSAFRIISHLPEVIQDHDLNMIKASLSTGMSDADVDVKLSAMRATSQYLTVVEPRVRNACLDLLPHMLNILVPLVSSENEEHLVTALDTLIELAESQPKIFRNLLQQLLHFCASIMKNDVLDDATRQTALELLLTFAEFAPAMCRKLPDFATVIIPICMEWMTTIEDEEAWYTTENLDEEDSNEENYIVAEQAMDRLARHLGGKTVLPVAFTIIPRYLSSQNWTERHAALMTISNIGEGCAKIMETELPNIINSVVPHLRDPHPRVRYAACNAIGQMSTDFAPKIQRILHQPILSNLVPVMDDTAHPRVQTHAAAALVNFAEEARKQDMVLYLDGIFERLIRLLNTGKMYAQEQAVTTIATVADAAGEGFVKYYSAIMPFLISILQQAAGKEFRLLRGKAIECATLIALAVGKEVFAAHAGQLIELMVQIQKSITDADDPQASYLIAAWARLCKVLGQDFIPYLDIVMPPLLATADVKARYIVLDAEEEPGDEYAEEDGWAFVPMEGTKVGIHTTSLEEKCTSLEMLICYARELGGGFHPYVERVMEIVLPLLKFYFHDGVRLAAAQMIPQLFNSFKLSGNYSQDDLLRLWHDVCAKLFDSIEGDLDTSFQCSVFTCYYECLEIIGKNSMTHNLLESLIKTCFGISQQYMQRYQERMATRQDDDFDVDDEDLLRDDEDNDEMLLSETSSALHYTFKSHGVSFLPYFEQLLPHITHFLASQDSASRQFALCIFDDLIEFASPQSFNYSAHFLDGMMNCLMDSSYDVRQTACYGFGVAAQFGGEAYGPVCAKAVPVLLQLSSVADGRTEEKIMATENAISAVAKICKYLGQVVDANSIIPSWFVTLPITEDDSEAGSVYGYLLELLEMHHPALSTSSEETLSKLVHIFSDALSCDVLIKEKSLSQKMVIYLKGLLGQCAPEMRGRLWNSIDAEKRNTLAEKGYI